MKKILSASVSLVLACLLLTGCTFVIYLPGSEDAGFSQNDGGLFERLKEKWLKKDDGGDKEKPTAEYREDDVSEATVNQYTGPVIAPSGNVTEDSLLAFAEAYDKDAYIILSEVRQKHKAYSIVQFYDADNDLMAEFETSVHEMCHITNTYDFSEFSVYTGDGEWTEMNARPSDYFRSREIADAIPEKYRTFRFETYITPQKDNHGSDIHGCFGLLDEFSAYCWGSKAVLGTYNYIRTLEPTCDNFEPFLIPYYNRNSYAEFRFYILTYLLYAKENHPDIYRKIMDNSDFLYAFNKIDAEFRAVLDAYACKINEYAAANDNVSISDGTVYFRDGNSITGIPLGSDEYDLLMEKMQEPAYAEMYESMKNH